MKPSSPTEETGSLVLRFGTAVGLAAAAAMAGALPAALRIGAGLGQDATGRVWTCLAAASLVPMVCAVVVLRGAREGLRAFGGPEAELRAYGVALWASSLFVALALLGSVLRATTHQHALAGVTFAFGATGLAVGLALGCVRVVSILRGASVALRGGLALALAMVVFAALGWIGMRFLYAASHEPASAPAAGMVVDILAFSLAALFAARRSLASRRAVAVVGPPVAVAIAALGFSALGDSTLRAAIDDRAPAFAVVVDPLPGR
ncbi:MAG TPA: hypothetical protein VK762_04700 [Polyangiaceae bacterium]|nr:hypothetical protein [Polyangiaceae bacterium]